MEREPKRRRQEDYEEAGEAVLSNKSSCVRKIKDCPYLSSIRRPRLDFDVEHTCSETGEKCNLYACLICGKFFRGRGKLTPAFKHALSTTPHQLFISLTDTRIFCLPENYEVIDASLDDIKFNLRSHYTEDDVSVFEKISQGELPAADDPRYVSRALNGNEYYPGLVGLNSIHEKTDYMNVAVHLLANILPIRRYLLLKKQDDTLSLCSIASNLIKQMFNFKSFKGMVLPHAFTQYVDQHSPFTLIERANAYEFLLWLLNELVRERPEFNKIVRGQLTIEKDTYDVSEGNRAPLIQKFLCLSLKLEFAPLLSTSSVMNATVEPHIYELLEQYGGKSDQGKRKALWRLPAYLFTHVQRFTRNNFFLEKNTTLVKFPLKSLDLSNFLHPDAPKPSSSRYSLVGNVIHYGDATKGHYAVQILRGDQWYEIEDLRLTPIEGQRVAGSQCFIQMWRKERVPKS